MQRYEEAGRRACVTPYRVIGAGVRHHVCVGHDQPVLADDEARALAHTPSITHHDPPDSQAGSDRDTRHTPAHTERRR